MLLGDNKGNLCPHPPQVIWVCPKRRQKAALPKSQSSFTAAPTVAISPKFAIKAVQSPAFTEEAKGSGVLDGDRSLQGGYVVVRSLSGRGGVSVVGGW